MQTIPLVDLKAQYQEIKKDIDEAIARVLEGGQFVLGPEVDSFEREFSAYCETQFGVGLNSGTSALHLALLAAGIGPGHDVITVPFTFVATVAAILYTGARPVFVDIDPRSFTMDPSQIEAAISGKTKAIVPVHLYGQPADMDPILDIARRHNLRVIEDAAQAHAAEYKGRRAGSMGDMGCFSFYPVKNLGAYGEAGMVVTNNAGYAESLKLLRNWGQKQKYYHSFKGFNSRIDEIQSAILRIKLRRLEAWTEARRRHASRYDELLHGSDVVLPLQMPYARHVYHTYVVRSPRRDRLRAALESQGIQTGIHYPVPVHLQEGYSDLGYELGTLPCSEQAAREVLSLPIYAELSDQQIETICSAVRHT